MQVKILHNNLTLIQGSVLSIVQLLNIGAIIS